MVEAGWERAKAESSATRTASASAKEEKADLKLGKTDIIAKGV